MASLPSDVKIEGGGDKIPVSSSRPISRSSGSDRPVSHISDAEPQAFIPPRRIKIGTAYYALTPINFIEDNAPMGRKIEDAQEPNGITSRSPARQLSGGQRHSPAPVCLLSVTADLKNNVLQSRSGIMRQRNLHYTRLIFITVAIHQPTQYSRLFHKQDTTPSPNTRDAPRPQSQYSVVIRFVTLAQHLLSQSHCCRADQRANTAGISGTSKKESCSHRWISTAADV